MQTNNLTKYQRYELKMLASGYINYKRRIPSDLKPLMDEYLKKLLAQTKPS